MDDTEKSREQLINELARCRQRIHELETSAERELQESEERFKSLVNSMNDAIYVLNKEQRVSGLFGKWIEKYGIIPENVLGKTLREILGSEQVLIHDDANNRALAGERVVYEWSIDWSGKTIYAQTSLSPVYNSQGEIIGIVGNARNITKLKQMEQSLIQSEKRASIGILAAGVAHEINNPLSYILSNLRSIEKYTQKLADFYDVIQSSFDDYSEGKIKDNKDLITIFHALKKKANMSYVLFDMKSAILESIEGAGRVKKIVTGLRDFSRPGKEVRKPANINDGIEKTLSLIESQLKDRAEIIKEYGEIPEIICDIYQLNQVFMSILINAAQAIRERGIIKITTGQDAEFIVVKIIDNGTGIPKENIVKLFDPFFTTKDPGRGIGLSLSIAYNIIKDHNGTIDVETEMGKGTTFIIRLPIKKSEPI